MRSFVGWVYLIKGPDGYELDTVSENRDSAWNKFCYPALRREAYEEKGSGFKCKRLSVAKFRKLKQ